MRAFLLDGVIRRSLMVDLARRNAQLAAEAERMGGARAVNEVKASVDRLLAKADAVSVPRLESPEPSKEPA